MAYFITTWLRDSLLITATFTEPTEQLQKEWGLGIIRVGEYFWITLPWNLDMLRITFFFDAEASIWASRFGSDNLIIFNPLILSIPAISIFGVLSRNDNVCRISILFLIIWAALFMTCPIYETRLWLPFVPFLVLMIPQIYTTTFSNSTQY